MDFALIGPGRAGTSLRAALSSRGWTARRTYRRGDDLTDATDGVAVVFLAVPDGAIGEVARSIRPGPAAVVHLSGSRTLDELTPHRRRGSLHPLVSLPDETIGARRLLDRATFAVAGDPVVRQAVDHLGGRAIEVPDERRAAYHAAASVAATHVVALAAQVERLAETAGVPPSSYWELMTAALDNATRSGPAAALTGPAARGDQATIAAHLEAIAPEERNLYLVLSDAAADLAGRPRPSETLGRPPSNF